jgi:hypothetical protein
MLRNYLLIGWRNLVRAAGFSLINIIGLAAGMCVALLIGLWIHDETSFNKSFVNYDRLTQVYHHITFGEEEMTIGDVPYPIGAALKSGYTQFEDVCMTSGEGNHILADGDTRLTENGMFVDPSFVKMFSLNINEGSGDALKEIHSIMLSETLAQKLF